MRGVIYVLLGAISYGLLSTIVKTAYQNGFNVDEVSGIQIFLGTIFLWILAIFKKRNLTAAQYIRLMLAGTMTGLTGVFYCTCLEYVDASLAIILLFQFTWMGVGIDAYLKKQKITKIQGLVIATLLIGTCLAGGVFEKELSQFHAWGIVCGLLSAVSYTLFILFSERVENKVDPILRSAVMNTGGLIIVFFIFPPQFLINGQLFTTNLGLYGVALAFFGSFLSSLLFLKGVPMIGSSLASVLGAAELPTAVLLSSLVLKEQVSLVQWIGVLLILIGIFLNTAKRKKSFF